MKNLQRCENLEIEVKFEKMLVKWNKVSFIISLLISIIGFIVSIANDQELGLLFLPLILFSFITFLVIRIFAEISMSLKIANHNKQN